MITFKFYKHCLLRRERKIRVKTYKEFYEFFLKNYNKGAIYDLKDDEYTK